jgi:hypothetical protein
VSKEVRITKKEKPIKPLLSEGGNLYPEGLEIFLPEIETKEDKKDGNTSAKKHHDSIRHGRDASESISRYAR